MSDAPFLTVKQIDVLRGMYSQKNTPGEKPGDFLTEPEFEHFIQVVQRRKLDPFVRQIYWTKRASKDDAGTYQHRVQVEAQIDGLRLIAERTGHYAGQLGPFWYDEQGEMGEPRKWVDVWLGKEPPLAAKVGVLRNDFKEPLWGVANWTAYAQFNSQDKLNRIWDRMGPHMLSKTAEALALRKAFPEDMSGLTIAEENAAAEMGPSGNTNPNGENTPTKGPAPTDVKATVADADGVVLSLQQWRDKVREEQKRQKVSNAAMRTLSKNYIGKEQSKDMMIPDCQKLLECLKRDEEKNRIEMAAAGADPKPAEQGVSR